MTVSFPTYSPALDANELDAAAVALRAAASSVNQMGAEAPAARDAIAATGFRGPAADAAFDRCLAYGADLGAHADTLAQAAALVSAAAQAQRRLDEAAMVASRFAHSRTIVWLNAMSQLLDAQLADGLGRLAGYQQVYDPLFAHPDEDLATLHARHASSLAPQTRNVVEDAGGLILEAGPASTTVMVGGDRDIAPERVITMVAGATTGKPEQLAGELAKARALHQATGAPVIVWQGYVPPPSVPRALSTASAAAGADDLSMFQAALEERYPDAQKTVIAHSYGTVVATRAATEHGLLADDLWLLGSPGVASQRASDLALAGPHATVHVVDARRDPIRLLRSGPNAALGASPSHPSWGADTHLWVRGSHTDHFKDPAFVTAVQQRSVHASQT